MKKHCGYLIDAKSGDDVVRKMTYHTEGGYVQVDNWYDYDGNPLSGAELDRVREASGDADRVNPLWNDDHSDFFRKVEYVNSLSELPATSHNIIATLSGNEAEHLVTFSPHDSFNGDDYYVIVINKSSIKKKLKTPNVNDGNNGVGLWEGEMEIDANSIASFNVTYDNGEWFFDMKSRGTSNYVSNFVIQNGKWVYSGIWTSTGIWDFKTN